MNITRRLLRPGNVAALPPMGGFSGNSPDRRRTVFRQAHGYFRRLNRNVPEQIGYGEIA